MYCAVARCYAELTRRDRAIKAGPIRRWADMTIEEKRAE